MGNLVISSVNQQPQPSNSPRHNNRNHRLQPVVLLPQRFLALDVLRIDRDARHRADLHALRFVKMTDAFGAFFGVDLVDFLAEVNRFVRAFGLAHVAVDALVGDQQQLMESDPHFPFSRTLYLSAIGHHNSRNAEGAAYPVCHLYPAEGQLNLCSQDI